MPTKANGLVKPFFRAIPRAVMNTTRFLQMLIVAGLLFEFSGPQRIQGALAQTAPAMAVSPGSVALGPAQTQRFSVANSNVTWFLSPMVGSITAAGLYTAPASITSSQTVTVTATSVAAPT